MFKKQERKFKDTVYNLYIYENQFMKITFSQLGATITDWQTKNKEGVFESIILKYQQIDDYFNDDKSLGSTVGPYAGRIYPPKINLEHGSYTLEPNFMGHSSLHSGKDNIQHHLYKVDIKNDHTIQFKTKNERGVSRFPGNSVFILTFEIKDNTLTQTYQTTTNRDTYTNLTNHTYFNLSGDTKKDILDHILRIPAQTYGELDDHFITTKILPVANTLFDFRTPKVVNEAILALKKTPIKGLDHPYVLEEGEITLHDPESGRTLEIKTDQDAVVIYSNNFLSEHKIYPDQIDKPHLAICLETQHYPNDIHLLKSPKSFHPKNKKHTQQTIYKISLK